MTSGVNAGDFAIASMALGISMMCSVSMIPMRVPAKRRAPPARIAGLEFMRVASSRKKHFQQRSCLQCVLLIAGELVGRAERGRWRRSTGG